MNLQDVQGIEKATKHARESLLKFGIALLFIVSILIYVSFISGGVSNGTVLIVAAAVGGYMAMNIGANDVANNVGPAVGSKALTLGLAILIAAVFEGLGALVAGGDVVNTIKGGIVSTEAFSHKDTFVWLMLAAILAGAIWLNIATAIGAPVSTTHSIVGGVLGAGVAAGGFGAVDWGIVGQIGLSWVISPVLGGAIAALFLYIIKRTIMYKSNMKLAALRVMPFLLAIMTFAFTAYLFQKGLQRLTGIGFWGSIFAGAVLGALVFFISRPVLTKKIRRIENKKEEIVNLFTIPLIFSAALLSFAHGANDVANAVGPLAAINDALSKEVVASPAIPVWVMLIGAFGIAIGLALYGPRLIKTVGSEITDLDKARAFCIAMAAALTVIFATSLGLPVSSTHIAVGGVFGVGFLREYIKSNYAKMEQTIIDAHGAHEQKQLEEFLRKFKKASFKRKTVMMEFIRDKQERAKQGLNFSKRDRKKIKKAYKKELVKRSAIGKIIAAWFITVPLSALMAAVIFYALRGMMLE
ncbi:MAG: inorganic phosphate transporter [Helicobacteraceae bacterium]